MYNIALVDDHTLLRQGLATMLNDTNLFKVILQADNGKDFISKCSKDLPDAVLMDITMPEMDGYETTLWLSKNYPNIKVLALSMLDDEPAIIKMLQCGAKGFILKNEKPTVLVNAIKTVITKGFYFNDLVSFSLVRNLTKDNEAGKLTNLKEVEVQFLKLACTELSYKEIADKMNVSPRTIDGYREHLFQKLNIKTRVGLAMYAIKHNIVSF